MKIALIWPYGFDTTYTLPLSLGYLKSNIKDKKHQIKIFDYALKGTKADSGSLQKMLTEFNPDLIGVSCWSPTYIESINILIVAKKHNSKIITILGGAHATAYASKIMKNNPQLVNYIFRGEAELDFPVFLEEIEKANPDWSRIKGLAYRNSRGEIVENEMRREVDLDQITFPDYDSIEFSDYLKKGYRLNTKYKENAPIWATRGCPYNCSFCTSSLQNGKLVRTHSIPYLMRWVKHLYDEKGIRMINIVDDNFTFNIEFAKEFCRAVIDLDLKSLKFATPNGIRIQRTDRELMKLMKRAGWESLIVAPESGSEKTLQRMNKKVNPDEIYQKVKEIKEEGLKVHGFFILGYPGETVEDIRKTVKFIRKCRFNFFFLNNFQPLPGTSIYNELVEKKEIKDGLLPENFSDGKRVYLPEGLKDFNFPRLILKEYLYLAFSNPLNIPYMFKIINPVMVGKKVYSNLKSMFSAKGTKSIEEDKLTTHA